MSQGRPALIHSPMLVFYTVVGTYLSYSNASSPNDITQVD